MKDIDYKIKYEKYKYMYVKLKKGYIKEFENNEQSGGSGAGLLRWISAGVRASGLTSARAAPAAATVIAPPSAVTLAPTLRPTSLDRLRGPELTNMIPQPLQLTIAEQANDTMTMIDLPADFNAAPLRESVIQDMYMDTIRRTLLDKQEAELIQLRDQITQNTTISEEQARVLTQQIADNGILQSNLASNTIQNTELGTRIAELERNLRRITDELEASNTLNTQNSGVIVRLEQQEGVQNAQIAESSARNGVLSDTISTHEATIADSNAQINLLDADLATIRNTESQLTSTNNTLTSELTTGNATITANTIRIRQLEADLARLLSENNQLNSRNAELETFNTQHTERITVLEGELQLSKETLTQERATVGDTSGRITNLIGEKKTLETQRDQARSERDKALIEKAKAEVEANTARDDAGRKIAEAEVKAEREIAEAESNAAKENTAKETALKEKAEAEDRAVKEKAETAKEKTAKEKAEAERDQEKIKQAEAEAKEKTEREARQKAETEKADAEEKAKAETEAREKAENAEAEAEAEKQKRIRLFKDRMSIWQRDWRAITEFLQRLGHLQSPLTGPTNTFLTTPPNHTNPDQGPDTGVSLFNLLIPFITPAAVPATPDVIPTATPSSSRFSFPRLAISSSHKNDDDFLNLPWGRPDDNYWDNLSPLEMKHYYKFFKKKYVISSNN